MKAGKVKGVCESEEVSVDDNGEGRLSGIEKWKENVVEVWNLYQTSSCKKSHRKTVQLKVKTSNKNEKTR